MVKMLGHAANLYTPPPPLAWYLPPAPSLCPTRPFAIGCVAALHAAGREDAPDMRSGATGVVVGQGRVCVAMDFHLGEEEKAAVGYGSGRVCCCRRQNRGPCYAAGQRGPWLAGVGRIRRDCCR